MRKKRKPLLVAMCALVLALGVNATIAWLTDTTDKVENTFTVGDINITLTETDADGDKDANNNSYKMVPGSVIAKDPVITALQGSEDCWVFVKAIPTSNLDTYIDWEIDPNTWEPVEGVENVWVCKATGMANQDVPIKVLLNQQVTVKSDVTKELMEAVDGKGDDGPNEVTPKLDFIACAVQLENIDTVDKAWNAVPDEFKNAK